MAKTQSSRRKLPPVTDQAESHPEIRDSVRKLCAGFPGEYWRALDRERAYPTEFVKALTEAGFLSVLIPEEYGGSGLGLSAGTAILEEIHRSGCNGGACHAQMYTMGTVLKHGSDAQKKAYLPKIATGELRLQAFGVTEPTSGTDTTRIQTFARKDGDSYVIKGQKIWISRAEHSDLMVLLARTTPRDQAKKTSDGMSVFLIDMRKAVGNGLTIRPIRTMLNHATTELFFDDLRVPADCLVGEEGKGFKYILDGMNAERVLIAAECIGDGRFFIDRASAYAQDRQVFGRKPGHPVPHSPGLCPALRRRPDGGSRRRPVRYGQALRDRSQYGQDAGFGGELVRRRPVHPDPWRFRLCGRIRHRAQVPRNPPLSGGPDLDQSDPQPRGHAQAWPAEILLINRT